MSRTITIAEATALADQWKAQREDQDRMPSADYFRDVSTHDLIKMWSTGKGADGRKLTKREFGCLVESWVQTFGAFPPSNDDGKPEQPQHRRTEPLSQPPADDTMLRMPDVERLTGRSKSAIKRMVKEGSFPRPLKLGVRAIGWLASDVRTFIATLDEQRKCPRQ